MENNTNNKVIKAGIGYIIGNYLLKGLTFLTIPIFTKLLSTADYGIYNSFIAYESILSIIIGFALHSSYKNAKYRYKDEYQSYVSSSILLIILSTFVFLILFNILYYLKINPFDFNCFTLNLLILYSFSNAIIMCFNAYVSLEYEYKSFLKIAGSNATGNILLSLLLICTIYTDAKYLGRIIGTVLPAFILADFIVIYFFLKKKPKDNLKFWKWGLSYSLPIVPHGISQIILSQFDRIMIQKMINFATAGIYSFAYNIFTIVNVTATSIGNAWEPWFYKKMSLKDYSEIKSQSSNYAIGMLFFIVIVMFISPELIYFLGSKDYWEAKYSVYPIIASGYFSFLYTIPAGVEYYNGKTKFIASGTVCAAIVNIVLNYIFIQKFGYIAAAYTTLFTYILYFVFHYYLAYKIMDFCLFDTKKLVYCSFIILIVMIIGLYFINNFAVRITMAVFTSIIFVLFEEKEFGYIRRKMKKWKK